MFGTQIESEIQELRARARAKRDAWIQEKEVIEGDKTLSAFGRQQALALGQEERNNYLASLSETESQLVTSRISAIEKKLHTTQGMGSSDMIAFRDAQDRADRISGDGQDAAMALLERASKSDDKVLALAVARRGMEVGWPHVVTAFSNLHPELGAEIREMGALRGMQNDVGRLIETAFAYQGS